MKRKILSFILLLTSLISYAQFWGDIDYKGKPWVKNISTPVEITNGLQNRHLSVWASHGIYYNLTEGKWKWQRPPLFCSCEDLFTQTIVIPYLIPMLENAGAVVFTPRERDWQKNEVIVDNDMGDAISYNEVNNGEQWEFADSLGFALHSGTYQDGENPFRAGTARKIKSTQKCNLSFATYRPDIPEDGKYAVYVSYQTVEGSVDDAHYTVFHKGQPTDFHVNQQMGGSTWVYLGTFEFEAGVNPRNQVVVSNSSSAHGVITTDAVRFGGGMGNIERNGETSGFARCLEGSRYYAQWAGMGYDVYSLYNGNDDYKDDVNARSLMTNFIAGGSVYMPTVKGTKVPIELSVAVHSDAGYQPNGYDTYGTLAICTTNKNGADTLSCGLSRKISTTLAQSLIDGINNDISKTYGTWSTRGVDDKNYSESRVPEIPSAIIETLSHQNFPDVRMAQDPNFKFTLARSIYKTILKFVCNAHATEYKITPLTPDNFHVEFTDKNMAELSWTAATDTIEKEADANASYFVVYTKSGNDDWDCGTIVNSMSYSMELTPDVQYSFRVAAGNSGGISFPSESLSACYHEGSERNILVINGFHRLSTPAQIGTSNEQGFDFEADPGVWAGINPGWYGRQISFDKSKMGSEAKSGLGYSKNNLVGQFLMGNQFDCPESHVAAIAQSQQYSVCSCSSDAVKNGSVQLNKYSMVDLILGNERDCDYQLLKYKTIPEKLQEILYNYTIGGGSLLVSGSYVGSDMKYDELDKFFLNKVLKIDESKVHCNDSANIVNGFGLEYDFHNTLNSKHYAATTTDILSPLGKGKAIMHYSDGNPACVAYNGRDYKTITMGFPFECIKQEYNRAALMAKILKFLLKK